MIPNEPPFRPSTELDNEWLTERPASLQPIQIPDTEAWSDWSKAMHALICAQLAEANPFGVYMPPSIPSLEDAAEARHQLNKWSPK